MVHSQIDPGSPGPDDTTRELRSRGCCRSQPASSAVVAEDPASLGHEDIRCRLINAESLRQDAHRRMLTAESQPAAALPRDLDGRTPAEAYHYWNGVVDAYAAMLAELNAREGRR